MQHIRSCFRRKEWEYLPNGWRVAQSNPRIKGWNVEAVVEAQKAKWSTFVQSFQGALPFKQPPDAIFPAQTDPIFHNSIMCLAYALALSSRHKMSISMLDWGGGLGHYYLISRALVPNLRIDYHCKDVPVLAECGRRLLPEAHFYTDESCLERSYDFVLASTSLHYSEDWSSTFRKLASSTARYILVTGLPTVQHSPSYVFIQRPYQYGYNTEYLGWCLNREQFVHVAEISDVQLVREFIIGYRPLIHKAPEQCEYRGYLFGKGGS
jgi:putative methyltransferase (TIGR04325 family)